jgi:hypothetical protein
VVVHICLRHQARIHHVEAPTYRRWATTRHPTLQIPMTSSFTTLHHQPPLSKRNLHRLNQAYNTVRTLCKNSILASFRILTMHKIEKFLLPHELTLTDFRKCSFGGSYSFDAYGSFSLTVFLISIFLPWARVCLRIVYELDWVGAILTGCRCCVFFSLRSRLADHKLLLIGHNVSPTTFYYYHTYHFILVSLSMGTVFSFRGKGLWGLWLHFFSHLPFLSDLL